MSEKKVNFAKQARHFVSLQRNGMLSTISVTEKGYPFGSVTPYDIDDKGRIIIYISFIAEDYRNLKVDPKACMLVADRFGVDDPQAHARASILLQLAEVPEDEKAEVQKSYEDRFPSSINHEIAHNFTFMRGAPERIRWIGGFGEIGWVRGADFCAETPDSIAYNGLSVIEHMNDDHADALVELSETFGSKKKRPEKAQMVNISAESFIIAATYDDGAAESVRPPFPFPVKTPEDARRAIIQMLKEVRAKQ